MKNKTAAQRCAWLAVGLLAACASPTALAENADNVIVNPGFEETNGVGNATGWLERQPVYQIVDGAGRNGSRALHFDTSRPGKDAYPTQRLKIAPGDCYAFEVWVRTEDLSGNDTGAGICMEWIDANGKYLGGAFPRGVRGTSKDWTLVKGVTPPIPAAAAHITVAPYVRRGMKGKAWFDDVKVSRVFPPLAKAINASCYRNTTTGGTVSFFVGLRLRETGVSPEDVTATFTLQSGTNAPVFSSHADAITIDRACVEVDTDPLPTGSYTMRCKLESADKRFSGEAAMTFQKTAQPPEYRVWIDEHHRLIVEGKPFFPLGMYWRNVNEPELKIYSGGPFNCLMPYGSPTPEQMDLCARYGLKVIYSVKDFWAGTKAEFVSIKTQADEVVEIKRRVDWFRRHPAMLAWYINDETPISMMDRLVARQQLLEELDPDHPTWAVLCRINEVSDYMQTFDVIGTDPYPIPDKHAGTALAWARATRDKSYGTRAMWQVPQAFNWAAYRKEPAARAPTFAEMRAMAWQSIAGGANGLVFYSFFDLRRMNDVDPFETRWQEASAMGREIARYIPVILSVEPTPDIVCEGSDSVETRAWRVGQDVFVLLVNGGETSVEATLKVAAPFERVSAEFGRSPEQHDDNRLTCTLAPLDPVMLKLTGVPERK